MDNEKIEIKRSYNRKMYPIYKMFGYDLLFHVAIIFMYLINIKGLSASEVFLLDSLYTAFKFAMQFPAVVIVDRLRKKKKSNTIKFFAFSVYSYTYYSVRI